MFDLLVPRPQEPEGPVVAGQRNGVAVLKTTPVQPRTPVRTPVRTLCISVAHHQYTYAERPAADRPTADRTTFLLLFDVSTPSLHWLLMDVRLKPAKFSMHVITQVDYSQYASNFSPVQTAEPASAPDT